MAKTSKTAGGSHKVVYAALAGNVAIAVTKFGASVLTGSAAMFSEAIHSTVDSTNQLLLLYGLHRAAQPPNRRHPFGYGREIYFWSFVVAIMIFGIGAGLSVYEGAEGLIHPHELEDPLVNYIVLGVAMLFEAGSFTVAFREFRKKMDGHGYLSAVRRSKDPTNFTVLLEDSAALTGLVIAFVGVALAHAFRSTLFDSLASILIGCVLATVAALLARESKGLLIGESAEPAVVDGIRGIVVGDPRVKRPLEILTMHMGPEDVLLNLGIEFGDGLSADDVEAAILDLEGSIQRRFPEVTRVFVEAGCLRERQGAGAGEGVKSDG